MLAVPLWSKLMPLGNTEITAVDSAGLAVADDQFAGAATDTRIVTHVDRTTIVVVQGSVVEVQVDAGVKRRITCKTDDRGIDHRVAERGERAVLQGPWG